MKRWHLFAILVVLVVVAGLGVRFGVATAPETGATDEVAVQPPSEPAPAAAPKPAAESAPSEESQGETQPQEKRAMQTSPPAIKPEDFYDGEYESEKFGYRFRIPRGWKLDEPGDWQKHFDVQLVRANAPHSISRITVALAPVPDKTAQEYVADQIAHAPLTLRRFHVDQQPAVTALGDEWAYLLDFSFWMNQKCESRQYVTVRNKKAYTLSLAGYEGVRQRYAGDLSNLALSWQFLEPKEETQGKDRKDSTGKPSAEKHQKARQEG